VEEIADQTRVDELSKKLGFEEHLSIMLWHVIGNCITRVELSDSLKEILPKRYRLIEISKSQLSKVNKNRDYRAFVWAFYELIEIWRDRRRWILKRGLKDLSSSRRSLPIVQYSEIRDYVGFFKNVKNLEFSIFILN